jgi:hypothetical protein
MGADRDEEIHSLPKAYLGYQQGQFANQVTLVSLSGKPTNGDTISLSLTASNISGGSADVAFSVGPSTTMVEIATGLTSAINVTTPLINAEITAYASNQNIFITAANSSTAPLTVANASEGSPTEIVTINTAQAGDYAFVKAVHVMAHYTVMAFTRALSDMNDIERVLWFSDIYKTVDTTIQDITFPWQLVGSSTPTPDWDFNEQTGLVEWYKMQKDFMIRGLWAEGLTVPSINEIIMQYKQATSGEPIELEQITTTILGNQVDP